MNNKPIPLYFLCIQIVVEVKLLRLLRNITVAIKLLSNP